MGTHLKEHKDSHKLAGDDAFLSTDLLEAIVKRLQEAGGPTTLTLGTVADGRVFLRSGSDVVGAIVDLLTEATVTTVGNAWTTIATLALNDNTTYMVTAEFIARRTDAADRAGYVRRALFYRQGGGVATLEGTLDSPFTRESTNTWDARLSVSGSNVLFEVLGGVGATVNWKVRYKVVSIT